MVVWPSELLFGLGGEAGRPVEGTGPGLEDLRDGGAEIFSVWLLYGKIFSLLFWATILIVGRCLLGEAGVRLGAESMGMRVGAGD